MATASLVDNAREWLVANHLFVLDTPLHHVVQGGRGQACSSVSGGVMWKKMQNDKEEQKFHCAKRCFTWSKNKK